MKVDLCSWEYKPRNMRQYIQNASDDALIVLSKMLKINAIERFTAKQLLDHPYFRNCKLPKESNNNAQPKQEKYDE